MMRAGFIGLIGQPNSGKSTFLNFMVKEKVSIVSSKPQTTRRRIQGILTVPTDAENSQPSGQIVFVDAPGLLKQEHAGKTGLNSFLAREALDVCQNSDALLGFLNLDEEKKENIEEVIRLVRNSRKPYAFLITKVDQTDVFYRKTKVRELLDPHEKIFELGFLHESDADGEDIILQKNLNETLKREDFVQELLQMVPPSPQLLFSEEDFTTENTRDLVSEFVREKCLAHLHQEVPFQLAVGVHKFDETSNRIPHIDLVIMVPKESHKRIVIGKGGEMIKKIGTEAREEIEDLLGQKVFLNLNVAVKEAWDQNSQIMKEFKYVLPN